MTKKDEDTLDEYLSFCARSLDLYFSAVKETNRKAWDDPESKILSIVSLNGFIIALNRSLKKEGLNDFNYYRNAFKSLAISFERKDFQLTASQYHMFSNAILRNAFSFSEEELAAF